MTYYQTKATYTKDQGDGKAPKTTKDVYLSRGIDYADTETRIKEIVAHYSFEGLPELDIKKVKYQDVFPSDNPNADRFYRVKLVYTMLDGEGDNLKEKKVGQFFLVQAWDIPSVLKSLERNLQGGASDYTIYSITETPIMDYFDFSTAEALPQI